MSTTPTNQPVPSEKPQDLKFNAGKIDEFITSMAQKYIDRFGGEHYTIEGLRWFAQQAIAAFGYITLDSFEDGNTLTLPNQVLRLEATGEYYRWDGVFPKDVPAGSTPDSTGGIGTGAWLDVGDAVLRSELAKENGSSLIGVGQSTLQTALYYGFPEMYGAVGDGDTDDGPALQDCFNNHAVSILSEKTYASSTELIITPGHSVKGAGKDKSIIKKIGSPTQFFVKVLGQSQVGYSGFNEDFMVNSQRLADYGIYYGGDNTTTITKARISGVSSRNAIQANIVLDAVQNSTFIDLDCANDFNFSGKRGMYLVNGAGNNLIMNCELSGGEVGSFVTGREPTFPCWSLNTFARMNANNTISRCIMESISTDDVLMSRKQGVFMEYANTNTFFACDIVALKYSDTAAYIKDTCSYNTFLNCSFGSNPSSTIAAFKNEGYNTRILSGNMDDFTGIQQIVTTQEITVKDCYANGGNLARIVNSAGNTNKNIKGVVRFSDTTGDSLPNFLNPNEIIGDNDGRYWASRGTSFDESVQFFTGYQRSQVSNITVSGSTGSVGFQLPAQGIYEIECSFMAGPDNSHRGAGKIRATYYSGILTVNKTSVVNPLVTTDESISALAASLSEGGFLTISITLTSLTDGVAKLTVRRMNDWTS